MTITSENRIAGPFLGNGSATSFPFTFALFAPNHLRVTKKSTGGVYTDLEFGVGYTVLLNLNQDTTPGGVVTFLTAPASGESVVFTSDAEFLQRADLQNQGGFFPETIERALDNIVVQTQQLREQVDRSIRIETGVGGPPTAALIPVPGEFLAFNAEGDLATASGTGADGALRTDLAAPGGSALVRWQSAPVPRSVGQKLTDSMPTPGDFGTPADGLTSATTGLQAFIDAGGGYIPPGQYGIGAPVNPKPGMSVICHPDARFFPLVDNIDMFRVDDANNAFRWDWSNGLFEPAGRTGVNVFNIRQAHLHGRVEKAHIVGAFAKAFYLRELCWDMDLWGNYVSGADIAIDLDAGSNGVRIWGGTYENFTSHGLLIRPGTIPLPVVCVDVRRATFQFGPIGVEDRARGTIISNVYTEGCTEADIYLNGAIGSVVEYGYHSAVAGPVCVKGRNALGCHVFYPRLQGDRSLGIFDFDGTNASCTYELNQQASLGAPRGVTTGIHSKENLNGNPEVSDLGTDVASRPRIGALLGGTVIMRPVDNSLGPITPVNTTFTAAQAADAFYREVAAGEDLVPSDVGDDQKLTFYLKLAAGYTTGNVSVNGVVLDMAGAAAGKRKQVELRKVAADGGAVWLTETAWR